MQNLIWNALVFAGNVLVHPFSKLLPRDQKLWAFGAPGGRFDGNSKYLFLWMSLHQSPVTAVWITPNKALAKQLREQGLTAFRRWSAEGIRAAARAGLYVVNDNSGDVNFSLSGGARIFNLWHGVGLKNVLYGAKVGYGAKLRASANPFWRIRTIRRFERPDLVLATSPEMAEKFFARCFDVPVSQVPALGYPRLDPALDDDLKRLGRRFDDYSNLERKNGTTKTLIYVPTLRDQGTYQLATALPDLTALSKALEAQNAELLLKLHPKMKLEGSLADKLPHNIRILPTELDIYPVLHDVDVLITDYSSLFFDYIFARSEGVVLYTPDFDEYTATERDLAWDYDEATVGVRAKDFNRLCEVIRNGQALQPLDPEKLALLRERFWGGEPRRPTASQRIVEYVLDRQKTK